MFLLSLHREKLYIILLFLVSILVFAHCKSHKYDVSPELLQIDNLMWLQPDSATRELSRFWANYNIDSTDAFNKHYFNLLFIRLFAIILE